MRRLSYATTAVDRSRPLERSRGDRQADGFVGPRAGDVVPQPVAITEPHLQRVAASSGGDEPLERSPPAAELIALEPAPPARPVAIVRHHGSRAGSGHRDVADALAAGTAAAR
jgi:hypothetical protein